ncbi:thiamine biosynthesis protein ThiF, partial [Xenorhabdus bovienii]|uniref:thiamine biosynthesis protein ThiF n=1 Tax=Xenorhabdus bovienii TaxID=40576 RepID=UPI000571ADA7
MANQSDSLLQQGIDELKSCLSQGDATGLLQSVKPRTGEVAAFRFPLPVDYMGQERLLHIGFPHSFPLDTLRIQVEPSPWLLWPHAMKTGLCLHDFKERPVTGTPAEIVRDSLSRLAAILTLNISDSDTARRNEEFNREITSYWSWQNARSARELILLGRPEKASELFVVSDPRYRVHSGQENLWLSSSTETIKKHVRQMTGNTVAVRAPQNAGFYLKLKSFPDICFPASGELLNWLLPHLCFDAARKISLWFYETSSIVERWVILELPGGSHAPLYTINLSSK